VPAHERGHAARRDQVPGQRRDIGKLPAAPKPCTADIEVISAGFHLM
jgi:hypothetical protein